MELYFEYEQARWHATIGLLLYFDSNMADSYYLIRRRKTESHTSA